MTVPAGISIPPSLFPFVQITGAPAAGLGNGYLRAVKDYPLAGEILSGGKKGKEEYGRDINQDGPCRRLFLSFRQSFEEAVLDGFAIDNPRSHAKQGMDACPVRLDG